VVQVLAIRCGIGTFWDRGIGRPSVWIGFTHHPKDVNRREDWVYMRRDAHEIPDVSCLGFALPLHVREELRAEAIAWLLETS
jgi:hypothetical protein